MALSYSKVPHLWAKNGHGAQKDDCFSQVLNRYGHGRSLPWVLLCFWHLVDEQQLMWHFENYSRDSKLHVGPPRLVQLPLGLLVPVMRRFGVMIAVSFLPDPLGRQHCRSPRGDAADEAPKLSRAHPVLTQYTG